MNIDAKKHFELCHELTQFCIANHGRCFDGWTKEKIFFYCGFHKLAGSLFVKRSNNDKVEGMGFAFPMHLEAVNDVFEWKLPEPGNVLMIYDVMGGRSAAKWMFQEAKQRFPHVTRFFTHRKGKLSELKPAVIERLLGYV